MFSFSMGFLGTKVIWVEVLFMFRVFISIFFGGRIYFLEKEY